MPLLAAATYTSGMVRHSKSPRTSSGSRSAAGRRPAAAKSFAAKPARSRAKAKSKAPARKPAGARTRAVPVASGPKPVVPKPRARAVPAAPAEASAPGRGRAKPRRARAAAAEREPVELASRDESPPEPSRTASADDAAPLPETYGRTRVRLLLQSPGRLFVHWDLSPGIFEELRGQVGRRTASLARLAVRITTPSNARPLIVLLPRGARSWYVDVPAQRHEYRAELGLMLPSGEFRALAASNVVRMPRTTPSPVPAGRRVSVTRGQPPSAEAVGELPPDEPTEEELRSGGAGDDHATSRDEGDSAAGSSELSARRRRPRAARARAQETPGGSSSDLRPRR